MASLGKKDCPNCNTEIGGRTHLCNCGWHFSTKEMRKDLLKEKLKVKKEKIYTEAGAGRKTCPTCGNIVGARTMICSKCQLDFSSVEKEIKIKKETKVEVKEEKESIGYKIIQKEIKESVGKKKIDHSGIFNLTAEGHAKRILSYGVERAKVLLEIHGWSKCWYHVDWDIVKEGISNG